VAPANLTTGFVRSSLRSAASHHW